MVVMILFVFFMGKTNQ